MRVIIVILLLISLSSNAQDCKSEWDTFIMKQTEEFVNPETSPLTANDKEKFVSLDYYDYDASYCVEARFERTPDEVPFKMTTSTDREPVYLKYGYLHFTIHEQSLKLAVYQSPDLLDNPEYSDYIFLPFGDDTNGEETYGSGRYIDFRLGDFENGVVRIDFNKTYNPLCAYNHNYSCPRPPVENMLPVRIEAGVKGVNLKE